MNIDQGLASNECRRSSAWGGDTPRAESVSRDNGRALLSKLIMPIITSVLSNLLACPYTSFLIAHG